MQKRNPTRKKVAKVVQHIHERIANKRTNFIHLVSRDIVNRYGVIAFEDLQIKNMLKNHHLVKSIADVALGMLVRTTQGKVKWAGSKVVLVDPRNTSQRCSRCGLRVKKPLSERVHRCP